MKYLGRISDPKDLVTKEYVDNGLGDKANTSDLASVATGGSYNDLSDTPASVNIGSASGWSAGSTTTASVSRGTLTISNGTAPSLTVTSASVLTERV